MPQTNPMRDETEKGCPEAGVIVSNPGAWIAQGPSFKHMFIIYRMNTSNSRHLEGRTVTLSGIIKKNRDHIGRWLDSSIHPFMHLLSTYSVSLSHVPGSLLGTGVKGALCCLLSLLEVGNSRQQVPSREALRMFPACIKEITAYLQIFLRE
uniref:Uncharacterized protein n=1 Tax=Molossus molossus TaxID=27622 RepID=A0A7J8GKG1_MOLMO|nr:hypothetical protein HJG59_011504 [Molossus molossus]